MNGLLDIIQILLSILFSIAAMIAGNAVVMLVLLAIIYGLCKMTGVFDEKA